MKTLALLCLVSLPAFAGDKHVPETNTIYKTIVVTEHQHDGAAYALAGAAITFWLMHRYQKRHPVPVAASTCPAEGERRLAAACSK